MSPESEALSIATARLCDGVRHWSDVRWTATAAGMCRADLLHEVIQRVADACADAEGLARRQVPRLTNNLALGDQLRVVVADLIAVPASAEVLSWAATLVGRAGTELLARPTDDRMG